MTVIGNRAGSQDISLALGSTFTWGLTVTENAVAKPWAGVTLTSAIVAADGTVNAVDFTRTTGASGVLTISLTAANVTTIGIGTYRYWIRATVGATVDDWIAGQLSISAADVPGTSSLTSTLTVTTGLATTLTITTGTAAATSIPIVDAGGYYDATDVEALGQELPARFGINGRPGTGQYFRAVGNQTTAAATLNRLCYMPVEFGAPFTIDRLGVSVTTLAASSVVRIGIYNSAANGFPGTLLLDAGTIDSSTTGLKEITVSQAVKIGRYWMAGVAQVGTPTTRVITNSKMSGGIGFLSTFTGGSGPTTVTLLVGTNPTNIFEDSISGALPATATPGYDSSFVNAIDVYGRAV